MTSSQMMWMYVMVDLGKNAVVFNDVICEQLSRFHKNRTTSKIAHESVLQYRLRHWADQCLSG